MIKMKVRTKTILDEIHLPEPMPKTLEEAKIELEACEQDRNWPRAAALKYAAIPWLKEHETKPEPEIREQATTSPWPTTWHGNFDVGRLIALATFGAGGFAVLSIWIWAANWLARWEPSHCFIAALIAVPFLLLLSWPGLLVLAALYVLSHL